MSELSVNKEKSISLKIRRLNRREKTLLVIVICALILSLVLIGEFVLSNNNLLTNLQEKYISPTLTHPFGTDWLGRDMFTRTIKGLALSIKVGILASSLSVIIALILGLMSATMGKAVDAFIGWLIDLCMGLPHLVLILLISFSLGGGMKGVIVGVSLTHWPTLTRIIRAEIMQLMTCEYIHISRNLGKSKFWIAKNHILPHLIPQIFVGFILLFPHAILHESAISFLGFGLSAHKPAIGIILSESMKYLSTGMCWLALFPGLCLLIIVRTFDIMGENINMLINPNRAHE